MTTKILLIENDSAFAAGLSESLEATGFEVRVTPDGKEGLDLARDWAPQAIVLCVELPGMSGYLVCQKLKKDDALKAIPLVLTSAEATEETFEKHRTLKARADDYLLKPYVPAALLEKLEPLVGLPEGAPAAEEAGPEEELVSLEEEIGLEASAEGSPDQEVPGLDLESLPDEPAADAAVVDDDLKLLDEAFDGLSEPPAAADAAAALDELAGERRAPADEIDFGAALADEDVRPAGADAALDDEAEAALGALGGADETLSPGLALSAAAPLDVITPPPPAGLEPERARDGDPEARAALERARADLAERDREIRDLEGRARELTRRAEDAEEETERARARADAATAQARKAEVDAKAGRDEARRAADQAKAAEAELAELRRRLGEAERRAEAAEADARRKAEDAAAAAEAAARAEALEREADELRTELVVARGEAEGARGEVEKRTAELRKRLAEVEATNAKNEERVVKAYQKIKGDEKVREKVRKALAIAAQLLDDGAPAESAAEKERRLAGARD
jgi:CheY-like chemotaxis protein